MSQILMEFNFKKHYKCMLKSPEIIRNVQLKHGGLARHLVGDVSTVQNATSSFQLRSREPYDEPLACTK